MLMAGMLMLLTLTVLRVVRARRVLLDTDEVD